MTIEGMLRLALENVPGFEWAIGVGGLFAILALIRIFGLDGRTAFVGVIALLGAMLVLFVFGRANSLPADDFRSLSTLLVWAGVVLVLLAAILLLSSVFLGRPLDLQHWLNPGGFRKPWRHRFPNLGGTWERLAKDGFGPQPLIIIQTGDTFSGTMETSAGYSHLVKGKWNGKEYDVETIRTTLRPLPVLEAKGDRQGCEVTLFGRYVPITEGRFMAYCDRTSGECGLSPDYKEHGVFVRVPS